MKKKRKVRKSNAMGEQVAFRLPTELRQFYEKEAEQRNLLLSTVLRNALAEQRASQLRQPEEATA